MSKIQDDNFFDVSHKLVEWPVAEDIWFYPLRDFKGSSLKLYIALCHFANRFSSKRFYMDDGRLSQIINIKPRQLCRARNKLRKLSLIKTSKRVGFAIDYELTILSQMAGWAGQNGTMEMT